MAEYSETEYVPSFSGQRPEFISKDSNAKAEKEKEKQKPSLSIIRHGESRKKKPLITFSVQHIFWGLPHEEKLIAAKWHLAYKFVKTECKIVRKILHQHCFQEVHPNSSDFNLMWTGSHLKPHSLRGLQDFQKINHFPRSYELTRKDRLYQNIQKMQHSKGFKNFDFIPEAYVLPAEYNQFCASYSKQRGLWIVKPVASSRGRGIFLINHPNQIPLDDTLLVSKYIANPLLVDGFKFDLRLYIGVTSFDPLRIYLYEEGLTRFATVKYDQSNRNIKNSCMHLTNYSVNKKSEDYVSCNDPEVEDYGNKWSFGALLRFLKNKGVDTMALVAKIEDLVIKTIIAGELPIATACKMFMPFPGNCFEIYGFDVLIDENLKPWLLEVNLSPSMACDSPMDLKIKSNLLTDMFNLTGFVAQDPLLKKVPQRQNVGPYIRNQYQRQRCQSAGLVTSKALSNSCSNISDKTRQTFADSERGLTAEELRALRETRDEYNKRGNFVRIFPSPNSRELYSSYLEYRTTNNRMLSARLFMDKASHNIHFSGSQTTLCDKTAPTYEYGQTLPERMTCYERQLPLLASEQYKRGIKKDTVQETETKFSGQNGLTQGQLEVRSSQVISSDQSSTKLTQMAINHQTVQMEDVIRKAGSLSKLQARKAFGIYLQRVKQRLVKEVSCDDDDSGDEDEKTKQDEQMSLVIRFLKRAARNLRQEFKVLIPSHKLPMQDRRRMLAQQLGDFVHIYDKETAQMKEKDEEDIENVGADSLCNEDFKVFLAMASETELEELLTTYTRVNNNASIFLGNSTNKPASSWKTYKPPLQRQTETKKHLRNHSAHALTTNTAQDGIKQPNDQQNRRLAGAVAAYGKSLAFNATKRRPASASLSTERKRLSTASITRPVSAKVLEDKSLTSTKFERSRTSTNEKSVSETLRKLARRQAERQYSARTAVKIETNKWMEPAGSVGKPEGNRGYKSAEIVKPDSQYFSRPPIRIDTNKWVEPAGTVGKTGDNSRITEQLKSGSQFDPRPPIKIDTNKWVEQAGTVGKTGDNNRTTEQLKSGSQFDRRPPIKIDTNKWVEPAGSLGKTGDNSRITESDSRCSSADETFFSFVHHELQITSKPSHPRSSSARKEPENRREQCEDSRTVNDSPPAVAVELPSSLIRIPCGESKDEDPVKDELDKLGSARQDYNKHMQLLIERLAAHKFDKTRQEKVTPKPPSRPRSAKRPVSAKRMSRITINYGNGI